MNSHTFSPTAAIRFGWETFKKNKKFWIIATVLMFMVGNSNSFDIGKNFSSSLNKSNQEKTLETPATQLDYNNLPVMEETGTPVPFVPETVDNVLGISDQWNNGNMLMFIILLGIVVFVLMIPYLIMTALIGGAIQMGILRFFLTAARGQQVGYELFLSEIKLKKAFRFITATLLYALLVSFGLVLLIIPGIYFLLKYSMVTYAIVDRDARIGEAFRLSGSYTKGNKMSLLGLGMLSLLVNLLGLLALFYGLLVTIPVTMIASAYAYDRLSKSSS